jgi:hypothetical protein
VEDRAPARRLWEVIEPIHAVVYFAPVVAEAAKASGLKGYWMGYFAGRFGPLGPVGPAPVTAMAFGFAPGFVARSIPDAWSFASPEAVLVSRLGAVREALASALPATSRGAVAELADLLAVAERGCAFGGRPLGAAWSEVATPDDPLARVWRSTTVLREHRGDGHVLAAVARGLDGLENTVSHAASGGTDPEAMQRYRGWTHDDWNGAVQRLQGRGLLDEHGALTDSGLRLRRDLEADTDRLAAGPVDHLGEERLARLLELALPIARHLVDTGVIPVPNPIGVPRR